MAVVGRDHGVLIAISDASGGERLAAQLRDEGYRVVTAAHGGDVQRTAEAAGVDMVILGTDAPGPGAADVATQLRSAPTTRALPILVACPRDDESGQSALDAGADDLLTLPCRRYELTARVRILIELGRSRAVPPRADVHSPRTTRLPAQRLYRDALDALDAHLAIIDDRGVVIAVNESWRRFCRDNGGDVASYYVGRPYISGTATAEITEIAGALDAILAGARASFEHEYACHSPTEQRWFLLTLTGFADGGQRYAVCTHESVTAKAVAERQLNDSRHSWRTLVETAPDSIAIMRRDGTVPFVNRTPSGTDPREVMGMSAWTRVSAAHRAVVEAAMTAAEATGETQSYEIEVRALDNTKRHYATRLRHSSGSGPDSEFLLCTVDVTSERRARAELTLSQDKLAQAQKMEAIGALAGGVAHDFNNLLTVIMGVAGAMQIDLDADDPRRDDVNEILVSSERAAALTNQLLAFARKEPVERRVLDLRASLDALLPFLRRTLGPGVELELVRDSGAVKTLSSPNHVDQVILNMAVNARDAVRGSGRLLIAAESVELGPDDSSDLPPGRYARLRFTDDGVGMDDATLQRIFEPFFTTKQHEHGTGLGLATCYGIARGAGGGIVVTSAPGAGTTFEVYWPWCDGDVDKRFSQSDPALLRGSESVLLVEDDRDIRRLLHSAFEHHGYDVLIARNGREAMDMVERLAGGVDLLVTDILLPKVNGYDIARRLLELRPTMPILLMTGFAGDLTQLRRRLPNDVDTVHKPFSPVELLRRARALLDRPRRDRAPTTPTARRRRLLVVDDNPAARSTLTRLLGGDHDIVEAASATAAKELVDSGALIDAVLCDLHLGDESGIELYRWLRRAHPQLAQRTMFMTGSTGAVEFAEFIRDHASRVHRKPPNATELMRALDAIATLSPAMAT